MTWATGKYFNLTRSNNGSAKMGVTQGTEYAVGIQLGEMVVDSVAIVVAASGTAGLYALSWTRIGDTADTATLLCSFFEQNPWLMSLASSTGASATGHGPVHGLLNSGIMTTLPSTTTPADVGINQEGSCVPQIAMRRSA